jgi:uracil-DNA glycosylase
MVQPTKPVISPAWTSLLTTFWASADGITLQQYLESERREQMVLPPAELVFHALQRTPAENVRVVILGQDPYPTPGHAHGLSFSVPQGVAIPKSLANIDRELQDDLGIPMPDHGCLEHWADQGVLLLNTVLTVRAHEANSHKGKGWELLTDAIIGYLSQGQRPIVFVLWGKHAQKKRSLISVPPHLVIESAHPSPLSAHTGFFGSKPFSAINQMLASWGSPPINWAR